MNRGDDERGALPTPIYDSPSKMHRMPVNSPVPALISEKSKIMLDLKTTFLVCGAIVAATVAVLGFRARIETTEDRITQLGAVVATKQDLKAAGVAIHKHIATSLGKSVMNCSKSPLGMMCRIVIPTDEDEQR